VSSADVEIEELVGLVRDAAGGTPPPPNGADLERRLAGQSEAISRVRWQLGGLAPLFTPVLVTGEPGTGRTTAIRALHELGATAVGALQRVEADGFVPAAFPESGAIVGVHVADVEKLSPNAQAYWARRLARDETSRLPKATRLFASTSAPLEALVRDGAFEPSLGRALLRFEVKMPPLRERREDVPDVARALLGRIGESVGRPRMQLSPAALSYLEECRFSGNVRELERLLERAVAYSLGRAIRRRTLQELMAGFEDTVAGMREEQQKVERERLLATLRETGGNITRTAEALGRSRAAVYRLIEKHDIRLARRT
jgi:two-component system response regulator PilR (NtrC family)